MKNKISPKKHNPSLIMQSTNIDIKRSVTKKYMPSHQRNHLKGSLLRNSQIIKSKKDQKESITLNNNNILHSSTLFFRPNLMNKLKLKQNLITRKSKEIDIAYFYNKRKEIYKNFKNKYKGPYMEHLIKKGYYKNKEKEEYPIYYNYYQICHLMNKKKFQLYTKYNEFLLTQDNQEYLLKYLENNQQYIMMNYLLYFVYNKDECVMAENPKKMLKDEQIKAMFTKLVENNYLFDGTMEVLDNIGVYFRMSFSNSDKKVIFLEKLKPLIKSKIDYLYIKDMPDNLIPNVIPNIFPIIKNNNKYRYLYLYLSTKKYNGIKIRKYELYEDSKNNEDLELDTNNNKTKKYDFIKNNKNNFNISKSSHESNKEINNILGNITLSSNKEENTNNIISLEKNNNKNNNINGREYDVKDIELFINKFMPMFDKKKFNNENKKNNIDKNNDENSLIENKNNIIMNNKILFKKLHKKEIFQTSLKGQNGIYNKNKKNKISSTRSISSQLTKNNDSINYMNKNINIPSKKFSLKKGEKNKKIFLRKTNSDLTQSILLNNNSLKNKNISCYKTQNLKKEIIYELSAVQDKNSKDFLKFSSNENNVSVNSDNNNPINKNKKELKKNIKYYFNDIITNNFASNNKRSNFKNIYKNYFGDKNKFKIKKFPTLKEFEIIYEKTKESGMLPKNKMIFRTNKYRAFSDFSGNHFYDKTYDLGNIWEEKKGGEINIKAEYYLMALKRKIKNDNKKNELLSKNFCSLKQISKYPNIYY